MSSLRQQRLRSEQLMRALVSARNDLRDRESSFEEFKSLYEEWLQYVAKYMPAVRVGSDIDLEIVGKAREYGFAGRLHVSRFFPSLRTKAIEEMGFDEGMVEVELYGPAGRAPSKSHSEMVEAARAIPREELLEWAKKDKRRFLRVVYCVRDLERTIKFYTECFRMKLLRQRSYGEQDLGYKSALLGFGPEESSFVVEFRYKHRVDKYDIGTGFPHSAIATPDVYKMVEDIRAKGGNITLEPGPVKGAETIIACVKDHDGYTFELIQRPLTSEPHCQVMLRVGDLERSIKFYEMALGMTLLKKADRPEQKYTIATMGYAEEEKATVLVLIYEYNVTEFDKGSAYVQVVLSTDDIYKSGAVANLAVQELGGAVTQQPYTCLETTRIVSFLDPDGWETALVDNQDFLRCSSA